jgi:L,D-transpeptidase ErfK/SrfK
MRFLAVPLAVVFVTLNLNAYLAPGDPSAVLVGRITRHVVTRGDSLRSIGARYGVDPSTLAAANDIKRQVPLRTGQELTVDNRHIVPSSVADGMIIVNIPQRMLFFKPEHRLFSAPIAVGSVGWKTPQSAFTILVRETDPTWDVPESIAIEARARGLELPAKVLPGAANPLGRHWLGLSMGGIGIHGTNAPSSVYSAVTHGCIRLHPDDVAVLFGLVGVGTPGWSIYEPVLLAEDGDGVFLEVHPDVYRRNSLPAMIQVQALATQAGLTDRIDWVRAEQVAAVRHGIARDITRR